MPSTTQKQKVAMAIACKHPGKSKAKIPQKVACEFHRADRKNTGHKLTGVNQ